MRSVSGLGRIAALGAVIAAVVLVALVLFGGGGSAYTVSARFINAGQIVKGNQVKVDGVPEGSVEDIQLTSDGQVEVKMKISDKIAPLRQGVRAEIKQTSLSGIANRYVKLELSGTQGKPEIPDGGRIGVEQTKTQVDLDQLFNTLDPPTRVALQKFLKGSAQAYAGRGREANKGFRYLNPALSTSSRLFNELTKDTPLLERFLVDSAKLVTALADRRDDLAGLIGNLNDTTRALGDQKVALAEAIGLLPPFMRRANTTFVNLRAALDDVDPLVDASKPVARKLQTFLPELRRFTRDAEPTVRDLRITIKRAGPNNDLINLTRSFTPLASITTVTRPRSIAPGNRRVPVGTVRGAFPEMSEALRESTDEISFSKYYTNDFLGWLDDFSTTGGFDAHGGASRNSLQLTEGLDPVLGTGANIRNNQTKRCPGAAEVRHPDGSNDFSDLADFLDCDPSQRGAGPE